MDVIPFFKAFPVYNIDQTNLAEVQPERVQKLMEKFKVPELRDKEGMYVHAALDRMIETQGWFCPHRQTNGWTELSIHRLRTSWCCP